MIRNKILKKFLSEIILANNENKIPKSSIASWIIAVCTILIVGISSWFYTESLEEQQNHNRLSVKPKLSTYSHEEINNDIEKHYILSLDNDGLGPAFIDSVKLYVNNIYRGNLNEVGWDSVFSLQPFSDFIFNGKRRGIGVHHINRSIILKAGQEQPLMWINGKNPTDDLILLYKNARAQLRIDIEYESIYEEKFFYSNYDSLKAIEKK